MKIVKYLIMTNQVIYSKIQMLHSDDLKKDLLQYLEFLLKKQTQASTKRTPVFGSAKGTFEMSKDFDEPLDDFNEYMPQ